MDLLESGGFDCDFVEKPQDRLVCKICHSPCRKAQLTTCCGQIFCESDLKKLKGSTTIDKLCPICRSDDFNAYPQLEADREINALQVYCQNKKLGRGCRWVGELADLGNHLGSCEVGCDKCGEVLLHKSFQMHVDSDCPCYCQFCKTTAEKDVISNEHKENCIMFPISCPNTCGAEEIPQSDVVKHRETCPLEVVRCEYHDMGCDTKLARKDIMQHYQEKLADHLKCIASLTRKQAIGSCNSTKALEVGLLEVSDRVGTLLSNHVVQEETTEKLTREVTTIKETVSKHKNSVMYSHNILSVFFVAAIAILVIYYEQQIAFLKANISELNETAYQNITVFNSSFDKAFDKMKIQVDQNMSALNHSFHEVVSKMNMQITDVQENMYPLLNKSIKSSHKKLERKFDLDLDSVVKTTLDLGSTLPKMVNAVHDHLLSKLWRAQTFSEMLSSGNTVAPVILIMHNFTEKLQQKESWVSSPFFAFEEGYQLCLRINAAGTGNGEGTHVSVFLHLMKGPHDDKLQKMGHFPAMQNGGFKLELLNQLNYTGHHFMVLNNSSPASSCRNEAVAARVTDQKISEYGCGFPQFLSHSALLQDSNYFIVDDKLYFRVQYYIDLYKSEVVGSEREASIKLQHVYVHVLSITDRFRKMLLYHSGEASSHGDQVSPVILKMAKFTNNIRSNNKWFSSPFYAFTGGYRMVLKLSIDQTSSNPCVPLEEAYNSTLVVNLYLMKGPYDDELQESGLWPLRGEFEIEILNQCDTSHHHQYNYTFQLNEDICSKCVRRVTTGKRSRYSWKVRLANISEIVQLIPASRRCIINDDDVLYISVTYTMSSKAPNHDYFL